VTTAKGSAGHLVTDAGARENQTTLLDKPSDPNIQAPADQLAAELIRYGESADRLPVLQRFDHALAVATSVDQVKHIHDVAVGMAAYARQANKRDLEAYAAEIRMMAERHWRPPTICGARRRPGAGVRRHLDPPGHYLFALGAQLVDLVDAHRQAAMPSIERLVDVFNTLLVH
jgi:hypothetical protein